MKQLFTATSKAHADEEDKRDHHFVSVNGEQWHEIDPIGSDLTADDYDAVKKLFDWEFYVDDEGFTHRRGHITLNVSYLRCWARQIKFHEPIIVEPDASPSA